MRLLIIEDEKPLSDSIVEYLTKEGYVCDAAYDQANALERIDESSYDCYVVDINLPDGNGLEIIKHLKRKAINAGIIIISARISLENRIEGLDVGADHYLTKPFNLAELNAHLKSIQRRLYFDGNTEISLNEIRINPKEHRVFINDHEIELTGKEYDLLLFFVSNKNKLITKNGLAEHLWGDYMDTVNSLDFIYTHIKNLRKKMIKAGCEDYIQTVYGVGYKFKT